MAIVTANEVQQMPRVTVVVPLYQTETYIGLTLQSVLAQTFRDFEVVVVDDGSRDRGPDIVRACDDPRIRLITQENRGLAGARNTGIRNAKSDLIALLDADDLWAPTKLERHVAQFDADSSLDVGFGDSRLIDENGADLGLVQSPLGGRMDDVDFLCRNPVGNGSAPVLTRRALDRIAFYDAERGRTCWFDESFRQSEDVECWLRLKVGAGCRFGYIPEQLTYYRINGGGLSANVSAQLATWYRFRDKVATYAPGLIACHGARAEAYQLRYLARRAVRSTDRKQALGLALRSLWLCPGTVTEEPTRTLATLAAAIAKRMLTGSLFEQIERAALAIAAQRPGLRI